VKLSFFTVIFISFCGIEITQKKTRRGGGGERAIIKPMSLTAAAAAAQNGREMKYNFRFLWSGRFPKP
jgi:hypothetical protein